MRIDKHCTNQDIQKVNQRLEESKDSVKQEAEFYINKQIENNKYVYALVRTTNSNHVPLPKHDLVSYVCVVINDYKILDKNPIKVTPLREKDNVSELNMKNYGVDWLVIDDLKERDLLNTKTYPPKYENFFKFVTQHRLKDDDFIAFVIDAYKNISIYPIEIDVVNDDYVSYQIINHRDGDEQYGLINDDDQIKIEQPIILYGTNGVHETTYTTHISRDTSPENIQEMLKLYYND